MRWLLAGYCGLALISISVARNNFTGVPDSPESQIHQRPRFYGTKTKHMVFFQCWSFMQHWKTEVEWYKADEYNAAKVPILTEKGGRIAMNTSYFMNITQKGTLRLNDLRPEDKGVYFCKINGTYGPGTELQVFRPFNPEKAAYRTQMKDGLMILQALLLAVFIGAILLRKQTLLEKSDSIYEEPETDHIYEGLTIETCGGGLYEELSVYAQADGAEAPWE